MKVCSKCKIEKDESCFTKMTKGLHSFCKPCKADYEKQRRRQFPDKYKESWGRAYKKHGWKENLKRKIKYQSDSEYKKLKQERDRAYTATGRRNELYHINAEVCKRRSRDYKNRNAKAERLRLEIYRKNNSDKIKAHRQRGIDYLEDRYIHGIIKKQCKYLIKSKEIPKEIIEIKRSNIKIKREIKTIKDVKTDSDLRSN